jgi:hypothetical protein
MIFYLEFYLDNEVMDIKQFVNSAVAQIFSSWFFIRLIGMADIFN